MNSDSEGKDWSAARKGDGPAFGRIFDATHPRVYRHALRLCASNHDAEDVTAGAFLELWRRRDNVTVVDGSVTPWLLATTTNLALNQRRGLRRYRAFLARLPRTEPATEDAAETALAGSLDVDPLLLTAIRDLPPLDQQLLALVALEGYPLADAAIALNLSTQATRSRWQRIKRRLMRTARVEPLTAPDDPPTSRSTP
jgi:RNA polymerase sigma-70 factor (ECF subfamily)